MNRLALVVVFGMSLAVRPGDGLSRFIGLESQIPRLVFVRLSVVAQAVVAEHQVVMCLQIFGINGKCLLEFLNGIGVALFEKQNAAKLVAHNTIARELLKDGPQVSNRAVVFTVFFESAGVKEIRACKPRVDRQ